MKKLPISRLPELFAAIAESRALYLPQRKGGQVNFHPWAEGSAYAAEALNTVKSCKDAFFPQSETIVRFKTEGKSISVEEPELPDRPFVLFGVRACDAAGMDILDRVFLSDPVDSFYAARREQGVVVSVACNEPEETCFCGVFGIDAAGPAGDVSTWMAGETLYWRANTEKGEALSAALSALLEDAGDCPAALDELQKTIRARVEAMPLSGLRPEAVPAALDEVFDTPEWAGLSQSCLGCGTCTFVCPTCQCYDIQDFDTGAGVQRLRCWDSCMYSDFTLMAHGNPRTSQLERFRQRFLHKLVYFPENNGGVYSCVGCGRCVAKCPISMNIAKVIKVLGVKEHV